MKTEFANTLQDLLRALAAAALLAAVPAWPQEADDAGSAPEAAEPAAAGQPEAAEPEAAEPEPDAAEKAGEADRPAGGAGSGEEGATEAAGEAEGEEAAGEAEGEEAAGDGGPVVVEAEDGSVLDDQTFEGEDDDFTPSEEIPVDEPIPFPTDI